MKMKAMTHLLPAAECCYTGSCPYPISTVAPRSSRNTDTEAAQLSELTPVGGRRPGQPSLLVAVDAKAAILVMRYLPRFEFNLVFESSARRRMRARGASPCVVAAMSNHQQDRRRAVGSQRHLSATRLGAPVWRRQACHGGTCVT